MDKVGVAQTRARAVDGKSCSTVVLHDGLSLQGYTWCRVIKAVHLLWYVNRRKTATSAIELKNLVFCLKSSLG